MYPTLTFGTKSFLLGSKGQEATLPDLKGEWNIQNRTKFSLDEHDEIYQGYGQRSSSYPYRQYNAYTREVSESELRIATLENDYLKAIFIPDFGGRLWELWDKKTGENLLYTNDVIRPSNLAIRNAWFSGGVEWNIGMIGHTPFTMESLFVSQLTDEKGNPILRMYEYERIRNVTYQMDFWLEEDCPYLKCYMRITNSTDEVVPMYWWSNMAVPEYPNGRVIAPAKEAFTSDEVTVTKTGVPYVNGNDISDYHQIPAQVDYFFHLPEEEYHYETNINENGYGLVQYSTKRLQGRKIFSWGNNRGSDRWQAWLTEHAGRYVEIQGGLGKTQYGCIPMAPQTTWDWMEYYGAVQFNNASDYASFDAAKDFMKKESDRVIGPQSQYSSGGIENEVISHRKTALTESTSVSNGSGYAILENLIRKQRGDKLLPAHLDFSSEDNRPQIWINLLLTGEFPCPEAECDIPDYCGNAYVYQKLKSYTKENPNNWYAWLHRSCYECSVGNYKTAKKSINQSLELAPSSIGLYVLALVMINNGKQKKAAKALYKACQIRRDDLSFLKDAMRLLLEQHADKTVIKIYESLSEELQNDGRMKYNYISALGNIGKTEKAFHLLSEGDGLELADLRECDGSIGALWKKLYIDLYHDEDTPVPNHFHFNAFDPSK